MNMVVSGQQGTLGVPKNNNALDHGNKRIMVSLIKVLSHKNLPVNKSV